MRIMVHKGQVNNPDGKPPGPNSKADTPYTPAERLEIIRKNIGKTYDKLAELCKCSTSTIYLDMKKWREGGGLEEFLHDEFIELHGIVKKEDPVATYKVVAQLLGRHITKKIDAGVTVDFGERFTGLMRDTFGVKKDENGDSAGEPVEA